MAPAAAATTGTPTTATTDTSAGMSGSALALTTTFTAPTQCAQSVGGLTMLQNQQYFIWLNAIVPVPNTTITSCYPSQFASSYLLEQGGVTQSAFSPLVCPQGYTTAQVLDPINYIACCPSGWDGIHAWSDAPSDRPAFSGTCFTNIESKTVEVTVYDDSSISATSLFTGGTSAQAYALPYEGIALGVAVVPSTSPPITSGPSQSTTSSSASAATSSSTSSSPALAVASTSSSKIHGGALAGAIIGPILGAALIIAAGFFLVRYRKRHQQNNEVQSSTHDTSAGGTDDVSQFSKPYSPQTLTHSPQYQFQQPYSPEHPNRSELGEYDIVHPSHEMDSSQTFHEMESRHKVELPAY